MGSDCVKNKSWETFSDGENNVTLVCGGLTRLNIYFEDLSRNLPAHGYLRNGVSGSRCLLHREAGWTPSGLRLPAMLLYGLSVSRGRRRPAGLPDRTDPTGPEWQRTKQNQRGCCSVTTNRDRYRNQRPVPEPVRLRSGLHTPVTNPAEEPSNLHTGPDLETDWSGSGTGQNFQDKLSLLMTFCSFILIFGSLRRIKDHCFFYHYSHQLRFKCLKWTFKKSDIGSSTLPLYSLCI